MEKNGKVVKHKTGPVDPLANLIQATDDTRGAAGITVSYGVSKPYAAEKVSISISLTCDQNSDALYAASQLATKTVQELFADVANELDSDK